uniref:Alpha-tubulin N-acetyltransferase 2 n=1 Tax=Drosophila melanogaster TaxID=7227 RepID=ATAT2_DROME|nr:leaky [Drosophila melanogaster]Q9W5X9.1 RecName: Full=Alpha-tubulin N-acetyltransferase 2; Short=Alpha-TAT 2; Short=TAT 2; AltName: Full=Acetyltransferase mec-17 homolog 2 [Drosophila melanogaster]AAF45373.1 leaky [Drosophila melanogaster]|eukprot:NP_608365.1 uncharacterized protein Dmel_CG17003 [Drosophila melanogaster]
MVEFAFDIKHLFPQSIIRVQAHSLRPKVTQCRRYAQTERGKSTMTSCRLSEILNIMGKLSADAQGLCHAVTSADKLASDQVVYLMADKAAGHWEITGLLKVGTKDLFVFDQGGCYRRLNQTPAILDFYVHESRQRCGQGKLLFEWMLEKQGWSAHKCTVDRPSNKMLAFMAKHYGLVRTIPQGNNFVLYEGFFDDPITTCKSASGLQATGSGCRSRSQGHYVRQEQDQAQIKHGQANRNTVQNDANSGPFRQDQKIVVGTSIYRRRWKSPRTLARAGCREVSGGRRF